MVQTLVGGLTSGLIYALLALGIVLVYRVSKFVNLIQGEFYVWGALFASTLVASGLPVILAILAAMVVSGVLAAAVNRLVLSRLSRAPHATQLLGAIGLAFLMSGVAKLIWGTDQRSLPEIVSGGPVRIFGANVSWQSVVLLGAVVVVCVLLWALLHRSAVGRQMRAVAALGDRAALLGLNVRRLATIAFALAGAIGALAGTTISPLVFVDYQSGLQLTVLGFIAAAFGGLTSAAGAVTGGLVLGVAQSLIAYYLGAELQTPIALGLLVVVLVARTLRSTSVRGTVETLRGRRAFAGGPKLPTVHTSLVHRAWSARTVTASLVVVLVFALAGPYVLTPYWLSIMSFAGILALVGIGLDMLLGYTGQLSLGQTTFMGIAAYLVALASKWWSTGAWTSALIAVVGTAVIAGVIGVLVLRLNGYFFALATLALTIAAEALANGLPNQLGGATGLGIGDQLAIGSFSLDDPINLFMTIWVVVGIGLVIALRLARSRFGRAMQAVGLDADLAATTGVRAFGVKLKVFVVSSTFAGVGGVLYAHFLLFVSPPSLGFTGGFDSVVGLLLGGFGTGWGAVLGVPIVRILSTVAPSNYQLVIYGGAIVLLVLVLPRGIVGGLRDIAAWVRRRLARPVTTAPATDDTAEAAQVATPLATSVRSAEPGAGPRAPLLVARDLGRRFGGLVAVDNVSLAAAPGRVLGLIGPNGAGKSTCLSLIAGQLRPTTGTVALGDVDITQTASETRARLGVARTFQLPHVAHDLTALDIAALGAFRLGRSGVTRGLLGPTTSERRAMNAQGMRALERTGIAHLAHTRSDLLSTGHQKMLELARALAAEPTVLLADEPAGGLFGEEVEQLGALLRGLADEGMAVVLVEHEMNLVMQVSDEIVVLAEGRVIGSGTPADIQRNQEVVDAYLGV